MMSNCSVCSESPCGHYNECPPGKRPYAQPNAQRRSIYTDAETWATLLKLGNGNASAGIREAVRKAEERQNG